MRPAATIHCPDFPCEDTRRASYLIPDLDLDASHVRIMLISESSPEKLTDHYYAGPTSLFAQTTLLAFQEAGAAVRSLPEITELGVYLTTAVKCAKTGYAITTASIEHCSHLLEKEITLFPNVQVFLLMGDVAIKAINSIARRNKEARVIPAGATYKLRGGEYHFRGRRALPSYVQAGPAFFVEKSKRRMIAEDIRTALEIIQRADHER